MKFSILISSICSALLFISLKKLDYTFKIQTFILAIFLSNISMNTALLCCTFFRNDHFFYNYFLKGRFRSWTFFILFLSFLNFIIYYFLFKINFYHYLLTSPFIFWSSGYLLFIFGTIKDNSIQKIQFKNLLNKYKLLYKIKFKNNY